MPHPVGGVTHDRVKLVRALLDWTDAAAFILAENQTALEQLVVLFAAGEVTLVDEAAACIGASYCSLYLLL